ncbi:MAG: hypothetical protein AAGF85_16130 [Bacteroidota bacterium]
MKSKLIIALFAVAVAMSFAFTMIQKDRKTEKAPIAQQQQPQSGFALEDTNQF